MYGNESEFQTLCKFFADDDFCFTLFVTYTLALYRSILNNSIYDVTLFLFYLVCHLQKLSLHRSMLINSIYDVTLLLQARIFSCDSPGHL
jgi:hypothetical protein